MTMRTYLRQLFSTDGEPEEVPLTSDQKLHQQFIERMRNEQWKPQQPTLALTAEQRREDRRQQLIAKNGSPHVAEQYLETEERAARSRAKTEHDLRQQLAEVGRASEEFHRQTPIVLAPFEARLAAAVAELAAAGEAAERARCARESEFTSGLQARKLEIMALLRGSDDRLQTPTGRIVPWRQGGPAPQLIEAP